jgi:hypothetical protein
MATRSEKTREAMVAAAIETLRAEGFAGRVVIVGDEPYHPYDRPPLSKQVLAGTWDVDRAALPVDESLDAEWHLGVRAVGLDVGERRVALDDGASVPFDGLVIATGTVPRRLPTVDVAHPRVLELRTLDDALALRTALAAARHQDRATAGELLGQASWAAEQLGEDANYWQTGFGPTNVQLHRLAAALDLGDVAYVVEQAPRVDTSHMPAERTAAHLIDTGRAMSLLARDDEALATLLSAEQVAPQLVRHNPAVRETVKTLYRRSPVTGGRASSPLLGLAARVRAVS